jgi:hypothetical protein
LQSKGLKSIIRAGGVLGEFEVAEMYGPPSDCKGKVGG